MAGVTPIGGHQAAQGTSKERESDTRPHGVRNIAIACQGGGAQAAYTAGVLSVALDDILGGKGDPKRWVGISGTSGGALTALVAWYGALAGGRARATDAPGQFWEKNSAQLPGERIFNYLGVRSLELLDFDYQLNPYIAPLREINLLQTTIWPTVASLCPPLTLSMRGDFFRMDSLLAEFADFKIIAALGRFQCIPAVVDGWQAIGERDQILAGWGLRADGDALAGRRSIFKEVVRCLDAMEILADFVKRKENSAGLLAMACRGRDLAAEAQKMRNSLPIEGDPVWRNWNKDQPPGFLAELKELVKPIRDALPHLLLGAVDVGSGEFVAFSSQRAPDNRGISLDSVLASTTIPWLFQGKVIPDAGSDSNEPPMYWDGLFSQNPPISYFLSGTDEKTKPDEIWVAQVNPQRCDTGDIRRRLWDRRNELSGNLSLNQEILAAAAINARIGSGESAEIGDKMVQILRIAMDSRWLEEEKLHRELGPATKMDRSPALKDALFRHGQYQARAFLPVREILQLAWNSTTPSGAGAKVKVEGLPPGGLATLRALGDLYLQVADMTLEEPDKERGGKRFVDEVVRARISWHCTLPNPAAGPGDSPRQRLEGIAIVGLKGIGGDGTGHRKEDREQEAYEIAGARMTSIVLSRPDVTFKPVVGLRTLPTAA